MPAVLSPPAADRGATADPDPDPPAGDPGDAAHAEPRDTKLSLGDREAALRVGLYDALLKAVTDGVRDVAAREGRPARVLDVGCGRGELLGRLRAAGMEAFGIDPEPGCVAASAAFAPTERGGLDDIAAAFPRQTFDAVVCSHVLEHVDDPLRGAKRLAAACAPGGVVVAAVPNVLRPVRVLRSLRGGLTADHPRHLYGWGRPEFATLLAEAGLRVTGWYADRVTLLPLRGRLGAALCRLAAPLEEGLLCRLLPGLASSVIAVAVPAAQPAAPPPAAAAAVPAGAAE